MYSTLPPTLKTIKTLQNIKHPTPQLITHIHNFYPITQTTLDNLRALLTPPNP